MGYTVKDYKITNDWALRCVTYTNYFGETAYEVQEIMLGIPWLEITETSGILYDKDIANQKFLEMKQKIKTYKGGLI